MTARLKLVIFCAVYISCLPAKELSISGAIKHFMNQTGAASLEENFQNSPKKIIKLDATEIVQSFAKTLERKTSLSTQALTKLRRYLIAEYKSSPEWLKRQEYSCCRYPEKLLQISDFWRRPVDDRNVCDMAPEEHGSCTYTQANEKQPKVLKYLRDAHSAMNHKSDHVYFVDEKSGRYVQYPAMATTQHGCGNCLIYDPRLRSWYTDAITPRQGKIVVIVAHFKHSDVLEKQKKVLNTIMDTIGAKDKVVLMVIAKNSMILYPNTRCLRKLETATPNVIQKLKDFIDNQKSQTGTQNNITKTFKDAFKHFKDEDDAKDKKKVIIFVTSSKDPTLTASLDDITNSITNANTEFADGKGLILTFTVANEDLSRSAIDAYEKISTQNKNLGRHYFIKNEINEEVKRNIRQNIFEFTVDNKNEIRFTLPYFDINGLGRMISACILLYDEILHGVACIAFMKAELLNIQHKQGFEESINSYAFLTDEQGIVYMHPKYEEPILESDKAFPVNIKKLEISKGFHGIYRTIVGNLSLSGTKTVLVNVSVSRGDVTGGSRLLKKEYEYSWKKIGDSSFWLTVVVSSLNNTKMELGKDIFPVKNQTTLYHRYNVPFWKLCYLTGCRSYVVSDTSSVFFVRELYKQPTMYYKLESSATIQNLIDYFDGKNEVTGEIMRDPSTARSIRSYVTVTNALNEIWKKSIRTSKDILWVYVGLANGLFRVFPGEDVHIDYDPRIRPWYRLAINSNEEYTVTAPYEDFGTETTVMSMARKIYMSENSSQIVGVMAVDVDVTWLGKHVSKEKNCTKTGHSCMILDKSGSLIYHESFQTTVDYKKLHITLMESHLARDLLRKGHMVKEHCVGYHKVTLHQNETKAHYQWFYNLDHINSTISEMDEATSCVHYTITPIKRTNLLLIDLQSTCTIDYPCLCNLNENSIPVCYKSFPNGDHTQCQCPCYDFQECTIDATSESTLLCQPPDFRLNVAVQDYVKWQKFDQNECHIKDCQVQKTEKCSSSLSSKECNAKGCQWCHKSTNGSLTKPFCSDNITCAGGILKPCKNVSNTTESEPLADRNTESNENHTITIAAVSVIVLFFILLFGIMYHCGNSLKKVFGTKNAPKDGIHKTPQTQAQISQSQINVAGVETYEPGVDDYTPSNILNCNPAEVLDTFSSRQIPEADSPSRTPNVSEYGSSTLSI